MAAGGSITVFTSDSPLYPVPSQLNSVVTQFYFVNIRFNIIVLSVSVSQVISSLQVYRLIPSIRATCPAHRILVLNT